jgi:hypothetical protein
MAVGASFTKNGKNVLLNRGFKSSPDYTCFSRFGIGTGTTTPAESNTGNTTPITAWSGGSDYKNFESGYPTFDEANKRVTWRGIVTATQANSNTIAEFCDFNTDTSVKSGGHVVISGIAKTSSIQITMDFTYRMV